MSVFSALHQMLWARIVGYSFHLGVLTAGRRPEQQTANLTERHIHYAAAATLHLKLTPPAEVSVCHSTKYFMSFIDWSYSSLLEHSFNISAYYYTCMSPMTDTIQPENN